MPAIINEPARATTIACEVDCCIVGGSCTGVFAAIQAARLGLRVAIIEIHNQFGGVATARMVNVWHSLFNSQGDQQIIGGLTEDVMRRLERRQALIERADNNPSWQFCFNPAELACELDEMVAEHEGIRPFLHCRMVSALRDHQGAVTHIIIEDKNGRRAIACRYVIDASGDADVVRRLGLPTRAPVDAQPPTMAGIIEGIAWLNQHQPGFNLNRTLFDPANPRALSRGTLWTAPLPGSPTQTMVFGTRVHGVNCADADDLTRAEREGRAQLRRIVDLLREKHGAHTAVNLTAIPASIGIRETHHVHCLHQLTEQELLSGEAFPDSIAVGTYRVDIHHQGGAGLTFRYLDGREIVTDGIGGSRERRWRSVHAPTPPCYHVPYRSMLPQNVPNLLVAGRHIDADRGAFGAIRVCVNCNQMGEAAGAAVALAQRGGLAVAEVKAEQIRSVLGRDRRLS